jgi:hypothetical protein
MMIKAARSYLLMPASAAPSKQSARDHSETDIFMTVIIFSLAGLLVSVVTLMFGSPQIWTDLLG